MADEIIVIGIPEVAGALKNYPKIAKPEFQAATEASLLSVQPELAHYPSAPAGSSYRRTGNYGRLWTNAKPEWSAMATGFEGSLGNASGYGEWVAGEHQAKALGKIGWKKAETILQAAKSRIEAYYQAAAKRIEAAINRVTM
jgi:hypothetical protein